MPGNTTITLDLIENCIKRDSKVKLKELGTKTILSLSSLNYINAYKDGFSDITFTNGGAGILSLLPDKLEIAVGATKIAWNFTGELLAIHKTFEIYLNPSAAQQLSGIDFYSDSWCAL